MNIRQLTYNKLNNATTAGTAVYGGGRAASVTPPYIVFFVVSENRLYAHDGEVGLSRPRVQVSCFADTYTGAVDLAGEVIAELESWAEVSHAMQDNEQDLYEEDTGLYHIPLDFFIGYRRD